MDRRPQESGEPRKPGEISNHPQEGKTPELRHVQLTPALNSQAAQDPPLSPEGRESAMFGSVPRFARPTGSNLGRDRGDEHSPDQSGVKLPEHRESNSEVRMGELGELPGRSGQPEQPSPHVEVGKLQSPDVTGETGLGTERTDHMNVVNEILESARAGPGETTPEVTAGDGEAVEDLPTGNAGEDAIPLEPVPEVAEEERYNSEKTVEGAAVEDAEAVAVMEQLPEAESVDKAEMAERGPQDEAGLAKTDLERPRGVMRVGERADAESDRSTVRPGSVEQDRRHSIEAAAIDQQELELIRRAGVPDLPRSPLAHRFVRYLVAGALEAAFWETTEWALHSFLPGAGLAVKPAHLAVGLLRAAVSFNNGRGVDLVIPVTEIAGGGYSADLRLRLCEEHPPPLPAIGMTAGWSSELASMLNQPTLDGPSRPDRYPAQVEASVASKDAGPDMVALTQQWQERAFAIAGRADGIDVHVVTFVNPPALVGRVELWPSDRPPSCPAWFSLHGNVSAPEAGRPYNCPRCGHVTLSARGSYGLCDKCD